MKNIDLEYLCRVIGNLAGIPIRIYHQQQQVYFYSVVDFPADPVLPYLNNVFTITDQIGYFTTPYFNYYGIVRSGEYSIVIGPSRQTQMSDRDMRELAFACDVPSAHTEEFISAMKSLVQMPLGSIVQILCTMNYVLNGEKRSLEDVTIYDFEQGFSGNLDDRGMLRKAKMHKDLQQRVENVNIIIEQASRFTARRAAQIYVP